MGILANGRWYLPTGLFFVFASTLFLGVKAESWVILVLSLVGAYYIGMASRVLMDRLVIKRNIQKKGDEYLRQLEQAYRELWNYYGVQPLAPLNLVRKPRSDSK